LLTVLLFPTTVVADDLINYFLNNPKPQIDAAFTAVLRGEAVVVPVQPAPKLRGFGLTDAEILAYSYSHPGESPYAAAGRDTARTMSLMINSLMEQRAARQQRYQQQMDVYNAERFPGAGVFNRK